MPATTAFEAGMAYLSADLSVLPVLADGSKAPALAAGHEVLNRKRKATAEECRQWWKPGGFWGVAILGGVISGGLEVYDFETDAAFQGWKELLEVESAGLLGRLPQVKTPRGWHVYARCTTVAGSTKLAQYPDPDNPSKPKTLIETRGEGGYVLAPGCPPACHETGRSYVHLEGPALETVPTITTDERQTLWDCARLQNAWEAPQGHPETNGTAGGSPGGSPPGGRPGDDYARRTEWADILEPVGWKRYRLSGERIYWTRPGKQRGVSASTGKLLWVFSSNASPFEANKSYSKFMVYALLHHGGDCGAAARDLAGRGYGERQGERYKATGPRPSADNSADPLDADATAHDLILANATIRFVWEKWLPPGVLTILASEPGVGKTRFCADLARRVWRQEPWPDGQPPTFPLGSTTLWVPADNQHAELGSLPTAFGFPPTDLYLNATRRNPFSGTMLDDTADLTDFEARIKRVRPALVFVDTSLNATDRTSHKPEDAKAFFVPLQQIAARTGVVMICVTHLNAAGKPLGRRIMGQGRVVIQLENPDPEQPNRRKLWVVKSNSIMPSPLGVTMGDQGNEYDTNPPEKPEEGAPREPRITPAILKTAEWLTEQLRSGPKRVSLLRREAEQKGVSSKTLYAAVRYLGLNQFEAEGRQWWSLMADAECSSSVPGNGGTYT